MATYNGVRFVEEQLTSILRQSAPPDEIVICDDSSTDGTYELCRRVLESSHVRYRLIRTPNNVGVTRAFELALHETTGAVIFIADQDDVWYPNKIHTVMRAFSQQPRSWLIIHDIDYCDAGLTPIGQTKLERFAALGRPLDTYVTGMATAVKRDLLRTAYPIPHTIVSSHDHWLHWIAHVTKSRSILAASLAAYRRHADSATNSGDLNQPRVMTHSDGSPLSKAAIRRRLGHLQQRRSIFEGHWQRAEAELSWLHRVGHGLVDDGVLTSDELVTLVTRTSLRLVTLDRRVQLLSRRRVLRLPPTLRLAWDGGYESAVQMLGDLIAPRERPRHTS